MLLRLIQRYIYHVDSLYIYSAQRRQEFFLFTLDLSYFLDATW